MKWFITIIALCLSALPVKASDVYWLDKNGNVRGHWHVEDGLISQFQSVSKKRCLAELAVFQAQANAEAVAKEKDDDDE